MQRIESIDHSLDVTPIAEQIGSLKSDIQTVANSLSQLDPKVDVKAPDLQKIEQGLITVSNNISDLFKQTNAVDSEQLKKDFKKIILLLEKVAAKEWVSQGGGGTYIPLINGSVAVVNPDGTNIGGGGGTSGGLTDTQLRASPVPVNGTITLDAATLAALETINAIVSGTVALDSTSLAALENIIVSGTVALDSATLAALESVTAVVSGTVALDSATLAALENITATISGSVAVTGTFFQATQPVSAVSLPLPAGAATSAKQDITNTDLDYRFSGGKTAFASTVTAAGNTTLITPATGNRIQLYWLSFLPSSDNANANLVKIGFGTTTVLTELYRAYAMAHWELFTGAVNQSVIINTVSAEAVAVRCITRI